MRPNAGTAAEYRRRLDRLVGEMTASLDYWIAAAYRANEPATMAQLQRWSRSQMWGSWA